MSTFLSVVVFPTSVLLLCCHNVHTSANLQPFGTPAGDTIMLKRLDAFDEIPIIGSIRLPFLDQLYDRFFVGTHGYVTFDAGWINYVTEPFPFNSRVMLAAFWSDIDISDCNDENMVYYRQDSNQTGSLLTDITSQIREGLPQYQRYQAKWAAVITFHEVKEWTKNCSSPRNTFQMVLTTDGIRSFGIFYYKELGWISRNELYANAGFNKGDGIYYYELPGSHTPDIANVVNQSNVDVPGRWIFEVGNEVIPDFRCNHTHKTITFVAPRYGSIFGGNEVLIGGVCIEQLVSVTRKSSQQPVDIVCKFGNTTVVAEISKVTDVVRCIAPSLAGKGAVALLVSTDGGVTYPYSSTYSYDPAIYDIRLIERRSWAEHPNGSQIQLAWSPLSIDSNPVNESSETLSNVDVDFFGWYTTGTSPSDGTRTIHIPLAQDIQNTGSLIILLSKINFFRANSGEGNQLFLNGAFRITKSADRLQFLSSSGWNKTVPMIWSQLTDMDVFEKLKTTSRDLDLPNNTIFRSNSFSFGIRSLSNSAMTGLPIIHEVNQIITPNFGQQALRVMSSTNQPEAVLSSAQWTAYYAASRDRLELATEISKCAISATPQTFCNCWSEKEKIIIPYNTEDNSTFLPCPPNANLARLDRGRFAPESSLTSSATCNKNPIGSAFWDTGPCDEHPNATLCVNSLTLNDKGMQQQCCYQDNGDLLDAKESPGGGRSQFRVPDVGQGALPTIAPGDLWLAQRLEEQLINRKPQEICCPRGGDWQNKECRSLRGNRRGGSAQLYVGPPSWGGGGGDPHMQTLDGLRYTFNGLGEYFLLDLPDHFVLQGRTAKVAVSSGQVSKATVWSGFAFHFQNTTVQLSLSTREGLNIFVNHVRLELSEYPSVITTEEVLLYLNKNGSTIVRSVSAQTSSGIVLDVEEVDSVLQFQMLLSNELGKNTSTTGLLGVRNGKADDDLFPRGGTTHINVNASAEEIFNLFGETWRVTKSESLFSYQSPTETYETVNDLTFQPNFEVPVLAIEIKEEAELICAGNKECLYDIASTGNLKIGKNTAAYVNKLEADLKITLTKVVSCGYPNVTSSHIQMVSEASYYANDTVEYDCKHEENIPVALKSGNRTLFCSETGVWIGEPLKCVVYCGYPNLTSSLVLIKSGSSYEEDDAIEYTCAENAYYQSGDLISVCTERGTWSGQHVICSAGLLNSTHSSILVALAVFLLMWRKD